MNKYKWIVTRIILLLLLLPIFINGLLLVSLMFEANSAVHGFLLPYYFARGNEDLAIKKYMEKDGWQYTDRLGSMIIFEKGGIKKGILSTDIKTIFKTDNRR